jgi:hypothetical protein
MIAFIIKINSQKTRLVQSFQHEPSQKQHFH